MSACPLMALTCLSGPLLRYPQHWNFSHAFLTPHSDTVLRGQTDRAIDHSDPSNRLLNKPLLYEQTQHQTVCRTKRAVSLVTIQLSCHRATDRMAVFPQNITMDPKTRILYLPHNTLPFSYYTKEK